jgi:uroporphyrinogen III methyltransferase/synthase
MIAFVGTGVVDLARLPGRATQLLARASRVVVEASLLAELEDDAADAAQVAEIGEASFGVPSAELVVRLVRGEVMARAVAEVRAARRAGHEVEVVPAASTEGAVAAFAGVELTASVQVLRGGERPRHPDAFLVLRPGSPQQRIFAGEEATNTAAALTPDEERQAAWIVGGAPDAELRWFDTRPLFGKRVVVTRARRQAADFCTSLRARGAEPVLAPAIEIHPPADPGPLAEAVRELAAGGYDVVAFTSANGVESIAAELARQGRDARVFAGTRLAVIGPGTGSSLSRLGLRADLAAPEHIGEALADAIIAADGADGGGRRRVLLPRARVARDAAPDRLRAAGFTVDVVAAYETRPPAGAELADLARAFDEGRLDAVTFTSTSTVTHLVAALGGGAGGDAASRLGRTVVASIGPVTTAACHALGVRVDVTAAVYTISGLTDALERHFLAVDKGEAGRRS